MIPQNEKQAASPAAGEASETPALASSYVIRIAPSGRWTDLGLGELWNYREMLFFMVWRDLKVRYEQTILGAGWAILKPLVTMIVFTFLFGKLAKVPTEGLPYQLIAFSGLLPWQLFANSLNQSSNSLIGNRGIILKVYFPRLIIPASSILVGVVDFCIAFVVLMGMVFYYHYHGFSDNGEWRFIALSPTMAFLPVFLLLVVLTSLAVGLWMAALNAKYRDVKHLVPFLTQIWMFASPVAYLSKSVPEKWQLLYSLNPMTGVIEGFRWALLGKGAPISAMAVYSILGVLVILVTGLWFFRRTERTFADVL